MHCQTHTLAMEWAQHGIRVNSISPGFVKTAMTYYVERSPDWPTKMKYYGTSLSRAVLLSNETYMSSQVVCLDWLSRKSLVAPMSISCQIRPVIRLASICP